MCNKSTYGSLGNNHDTILHVGLEGETEGVFSGDAACWDAHVGAFWRERQGVTELKEKEKVFEYWKHVKQKQIDSELS